MPSGLETMPADALAAWKAVLNLQHMLGITLNTLCGGAGGLPARTVLHDYELWLLPGSMDNKASRRGRDEQPSKVTLRECMMAFYTVIPWFCFQQCDTWLSHCPQDAARPEAPGLRSLPVFMRCSK